MKGSTAEVTDSAQYLHCTCSFARRSRNAYGVMFCSHIQQVMDERNDQLPELSVAHLIVLAHSPAPDFEPFSLPFQIGPFDKLGMREVAMGDDVIGYIEPDACRADVVDLAVPYLVDWSFKYTCFHCHTPPARELLATDEGLSEVVRYAVTVKKHKYCPACVHLVPSI